MQRNYAHEKLIAIIRRAGYGVSKEGVCFGVAIMGLQAMLSGELAKFNTRLDKLFGLNNQQIERLYLFLISRSEEGEHYEPQPDLSPDEWEMVTFCQNIALHLEPYKHQEYFDTLTLNQDPVKTTNLLAPNILRASSYINIDTGKKIKRDDAEFSDLLEQGKLRKIYGESKIKFYDTITSAFDAATLAEYFTLVKQQLFGRQSVLPHVLLLSNANHSISVTYDPEQKLWMLVDANQLPAYVVAEHDIAATVIHALSGSKNGCAIFQTRFIGLKSEHEILTLDSIEKIKQWNMKNLEANTNRLAMLRDDDNSSYILIAAKTGDLETLKKLQKGDVNAAGPDGYTPLMMAASNGHFNVVQELLQRGADTKLLDKHGRDAHMLDSMTGNNIVADHIINPSTRVSELGKFAPQATQTQAINTENTTFRKNK